MGKNWLPSCLFHQREVKHDLELLINHRIIESVKFADWAAPIVPGLKPDNSISLQFLEIMSAQSAFWSKSEQYPVTKLEDFFSKHQGLKSLVNWIWAMNIKRYS